MIGGEAKAVFDSLIEPHERFHQISKMALERKAAGKLVEAEELVTEMHQLSTLLVRRLIALDNLAVDSKTERKTLEAAC